MIDRTQIIDVTKSLFDSSYSGDVAAFQRHLNEGADINAVENTTGLSSLHIAIGRNHLNLVRFLLDHGASIAPDRQGRGPSTIAELCEADEQICDLIADAEARAQGV
jgi:ankyrin repeat protein